MCRVLLLFFVISCGGCGDSHPTTYPVKGIVKFEDGTLLTEGTVEFETQFAGSAVTATAEIAADGRFQLGTYAADDGALPGTHRAVVLSDFSIGTEMERPGTLPKPAVSARYRDFKTSGLQFEVSDDGENSVEIILKR